VGRLADEARWEVVKVETGDLDGVEAPSLNLGQQAEMVLVERRSPK